jgi:nitrogen fixation protein NifX
LTKQVEDNDMTLERRLKLVKPPDSMPPPQPGPALKVAFASADMRHVDQHFGAAEGFVIHAIDADTVELVEVAQFGRLDMDGNEDKLAAKIDALAGCHIVYCQAVGASAIAQLRNAGIQPIKVTPGTAIKGLVRDLQRELRDGPSSWLSRAMALQAPRDADRFDTMAAEGWSE